jgi:hypothetical protein
MLWREINNVDGECESDKTHKYTLGRMSSVLMLQHVVTTGI